MGRKIYKDMNKAFGPGSHGFPNTCIECGGNLNSNGDFDYASEWTASYTCEKCKLKYAYQPTDMGQTLPWLMRYDNKNDVFEPFN